jgi:N6-L-threonylcarbamoyladenine synthase
MMLPARHLINRPKLLGLGYPGGPSLAALADEVTTSAFTLPKVAREIAGFSFSGLKTAVSLLIRANTSPAARPELAYAIQQAIVESLLYKCELAIDSTGAQRIVVSGGVAANKALRAEMQKLTAKKRNTKVFFPTFAHCTDNAAMIGYVAALRYRAGCNAPAEWEVFPRWPVEDTQLLYQQNAL